MDIDRARVLSRAAREAKTGQAGREARTAALNQVLVQEFHAERASALARANERYVAARNHMRALEADPTAPAEERLASRTRFRTTRWELVVMREAIGLRSHHDIDAMLDENPGRAYETNTESG